MAPRSKDFFSLLPWQAGCTFWVVMLGLLVSAPSSQAVLLWGDLGATQVHETGPGVDILGGILKRNHSSTDTLYFKFHVDPLSDAATEEYLAAFQLFEEDHERLAVGNALKALGLQRLFNRADRPV